MAADDPIIIIGSGMAGYNVAREFRKLNTAAELVVIADDAAEFYSKPMLSNALAKNKTAEELAIATAEKMAGDLDATILKHTRVESIDPENQTVLISDNKTLNYSQLVLALGASTINLAVTGNAQDKIHTVNDLASYADFRKTIADKKSVAIIGAGLIGCEFANDLVLSNYDVSIVGLDDVPLNHLLPQQAGEYLKNELAKQGINWHLGTQAKQINFSESVFKIELEDETVIEVDAVLSAIGLRPNIKLAKEAGLDVNKGIVVNQHLATKQQNIFALGDCAEVSGLFLPYVMPLMNAARALAKTLNGEVTPVNYPAMPVLVKTPSCAVVVATAAKGVEGEWTINENEQGVHAQYVDSKGQLQGFALVGNAVEDKQHLTKQLPAVL